MNSQKVMIRRENKKHFSTKGHGATKILVFVLYLLPIAFYPLALAICPWTSNEISLISLPIGCSSRHKLAFYEAANE